MKKAFALILLLVYFTVSSGFAVSLHYCMNKMASASVGSKESDKCGKCGMATEDKEGCCRDEVKVVKLYQDTVASQFVQFDFNFFTPPVSISSYLLAPFKNVDEKKANQPHAPPLISKQDTYLTNCVFRI